MSPHQHCRLKASVAPEGKAVRNTYLVSHSVSPQRIHGGEKKKIGFSNLVGGDGTLEIMKQEIFPS